MQFLDTNVVLKCYLQYSGNRKENLTTSFSVLHNRCGTNRANVDKHHCGSYLDWVLRRAAKNESDDWLPNVAYEVIIQLALNI